MKKFALGLMTVVFIACGGGAEEDSGMMDDEMAEESEMMADSTEQMGKGMQKGMMPPDSAMAQDTTGA